jgi:hypothetical protein
MIKFLQKLAVVSVKDAILFAKFMGGNILLIITSVPEGERGSRGHFLFRP